MKAFYTIYSDFALLERDDMTLRIFVNCSATYRFSR